MIPYQLVWAIFLLPLFSFVLISFVLKPALKDKPRVSAITLITCLSISLILSLWTLSTILRSPDHMVAVPDMTWMVLENGITLHIGLLIDPLTSVMLVVVTIVSLMVQIYSQGYMHGDPGYHRYFGWMSLFTTAMLGLVMANNLVLVFAFWELVGLCSYLLIGFWFHRPSAANAAKKAFIVTRIGDFGFLAAILLLYATTGTLDINQLHEMAITGALAGTTLTWAAIGIFAGAMGKSAQFPLHTWLPDAMEGPTPVSALIHAATMVAAGVFLVARMFPLFAQSADAVMVVAVIGAFTAIFAASMGLVMNDIKRVVAYSTISQLGYMMLGLGAAGLVLRHEGGNITLEAAKAAVAIGIFHLFNHAFFKALLFLGSGSVNHTTGTFDMRLMGGLKKAMPITYITFLIGGLSLAGIWPLAGFWSKDEVLALAQAGQPVLFILAMITVFMTAFYIFRVIFLTFGGEYKGGAPSEHGSHSSHDAHGGHKLHESPRVMVVPMVVLTVLAVGSGWFNVTGGFGLFFGEGESKSVLEGLFGIFTHPLPWISLAVAGLGILLAYGMYSVKKISAETVGAIFAPFYKLFSNKWYFDELYENIFVKKILLNGFFVGLQKFDSSGVDGAVNGVAQGAIAGGKSLRKLQTGQLQLYGLFIGIGIIAIAVVLFIVR